jgi:CspA family cold shock protein
MNVGRVLWFNESKGYGYISDLAGREIYFHYTAIAEHGANKRMSGGAKVCFDLLDTRSGWEAANVRFVGEMAV